MTGDAHSLYLEQLGELGPLALLLVLGFIVLGPVYSLMASGTNRIIGFTRITVIRDPARLVNPCAVLISRGASLVAPANATAHLADGLPLGVGTSSAEVSELFDKNLVRNGEGNYNPVLVPVLAR